MQGKRTLIALLFLSGWSGPAAPAPTTTLVEGNLSKAENTCVSPAQFFQFTYFQLCSYSGGVDIAAVVTSAPSLDHHNWMGPLNSGGFYAQNFLDSPRVDGGYSGSTLADGKIALPITGELVIEDSGTPMPEDDRVRGTLVIGTGERGVNTNDGWAVERFDSITHTLPTTQVSSAMANAFGGYDYVIGSAGFPLLLESAAGPFPSEEASVLGDNPIPPDFNAWEVSAGGNITLPVYQSPPLGGFTPHSVEIVSYAPGAAGNSNVEPNIGMATTVVTDNLTCVSGDADSTPDMTNPDPPAVAELIDDCNPDPAIGAGSTWAVSGAEFDNLILKISTDANNHVIEVDAFYVLEYKIESLNLNDGKPGSWVGGTLHLVGNSDFDNDGVDDDSDNCLNTPNPEQRDTDGDGYGNLCDADFNCNGLVDPGDFSLLKARFGSSSHPDQDLNSNGIVDPSDFSRLKSVFGLPPGPSRVGSCP